jgi:hypothetical protein
LSRLFEQKENFSLRGSFSQLATLKKFSRPLTDIDIITFDKIETTNNYVKEVIHGNSTDDIKFEIKQSFINNFMTQLFSNLPYKVADMSLADFGRKEIVFFVKPGLEEYLELTDEGYRWKA